MLLVLLLLLVVFVVAVVAELMEMALGCSLTALAVLTVGKASEGLSESESVLAKARADGAGIGVMGGARQDGRDGRTEALATIGLRRSNAQRRRHCYRVDGMAARFNTLATTLHAPALSVPALLIWHKKTPARTVSTNPPAYSASFKQPSIVHPDYGMHLPDASPHSSR